MPTTPLSERQARICRHTTGAGTPHYEAQLDPQTGLLLLHLNMLHAPLTYKLWRVSYKIRHAETRLLKIWDGLAVKTTLREAASQEAANGEEGLLGSVFPEQDHLERGRSQLAKLSLEVLRCQRPPTHR